MQILFILKLPDIKRVWFRYIPETNADLLHFLKHSAPNETKIFAFGGDFNSLFKIDYYLDGLDTSIKGVTKEVFYLLVDSFKTESGKSVQE